MTCKSPYNALMQWTRNRPTVNGYYWYRRFTDDLVRLLLVTARNILDEPIEPRVGEDGENKWMISYFEGGEWAGPLCPPR